MTMLNNGIQFTFVTKNAHNSRCWLWLLRCSSIPFLSIKLRGESSFRLASIRTISHQGSRDPASILKTHPILALFTLRLHSPSTLDQECYHSRSNVEFVNICPLSFSKCASRVWWRRSTHLPGKWRVVYWHWVDSSRVDTHCPMLSLPDPLFCFQVLFAVPRDETLQVGGLLESIEQKNALVALILSPLSTSTNAYHARREQR